MKIRFQTETKLIKTYEFEQDNLNFNDAHAVDECIHGAIQPANVKGAMKGVEVILVKSIERIGSAKATH